MLGVNTANGRQQTGNDCRSEFQKGESTELAETHRTVAEMARVKKASGAHDNKQKETILYLAFRTGKVLVCGRLPSARVLAAQRKPGVQKLTGSKDC